MAKESYSPDNLEAGHLNKVTERVQILSGQNLTRGAVLGRVTASDKLVQYASDNDDGSQVPRGILIADVDATSGDTWGDMYVTGEFNENDIGLVSGDTITRAFRQQLKDIGIHLKKGQTPNSDT